jgi:hypothetical protein
MKRFALLTITGILFLALWNCMVPFSQKIMVLESRSDELKSVTRIEHEEKGDILLLGLIPLGETPDIKQVLIKTRLAYNCSDLKNVEIEYYNHFFLLISFPKMLISADCVAGG